MKENIENSDVQELAEKNEKLNTTDPQAKNFIMSPKVDFTFKELMEDGFVRKGFISAVLGIDPETIKKTVIINQNTRKKSNDEKLCILDVRLTMNDDTEIDMEMQLCYMKAWADRSLVYLSKMFCEQPNINKKYTNLKKCINISVLNFKYIQDKERPDKFHSVFHFREDETDMLYTDKMECHVVELPKLPPLSDGTALYDWGKFFTAETREEFEMAAKRNEYIKKAYENLDVISSDMQKRVEYTSRQKAIYDYNTICEEHYESGYDDGVQYGLQQGMTQERENSIKNMISSFKEFDIPKESAIKKVMEKYHLKNSQAESYVNSIWQ